MPMQYTECLVVKKIISNCIRNVLIFFLFLLNGVYDYLFILQDFKREDTFSQMAILPCRPLQELSRR